MVFVRHSLGMCVGFQAFKLQQGQSGEIMSCLGYFISSALFRFIKHDSIYYSMLFQAVPCHASHALPHYSLVPCYSKLFHVIPHCSRLFQMISSYSMLFHNIPSYSTSFHVIPCDSMFPGYSLLFYVIPWYPRLFQTIPYYSTLFYTIPCYSLIPNSRESLTCGFC